MKIIKPIDVVVLRESDFGWEKFVETFDWPTFFRECHNEIYVDPLDLDDEVWGITVKKGGYRIISLGLSLTFEDMQALKSSYGSARPNATWTRLAFRLVDNLLFVLNDWHGTCEAIVRIEQEGNEYVAVEFLQDLVDLRTVDEPYFYATYTASWLSELLPEKRFKQGPLDEDFSWREQGDPLFT